MRNSQNNYPNFFVKKSVFLKFLGLMISGAGMLGSAKTWAAAPDSAPVELKEILTQIDSAANRQDIEAVMNFYGTNFTHVDGFNRDTLSKALVEFWGRYPKINYNTQLQSWEQEGQGMIAETITKITAEQTINGRQLTLNASLHSRQRYEGQKIVQQEILNERSEITSGTQPPTLEIKLPQQVKVGEKYSFDAIIQEPIGNDFVIGNAIVEPVAVESYLKPSSINLELLQAGGLFKIGTAPATAQSEWLSAIIVRKNGMIAVTQRLKTLQ